MGKKEASTDFEKEQKQISEIVEELTKKLDKIGYYVALTLQRKKPLPDYTTPPIAQFGIITPYGIIKTLEHLRDDFPEVWKNFVIETVKKEQQEEGPIILASPSRKTN